LGEIKEKTILRAISLELFSDMREAEGIVWPGEKQISALRCEMEQG